MPLFDGLSLFEWVLLVLGSVFFVVLLGVFLKLSLHNKPYKNLLFFFIFPIVMIGFPAIQSVQLNKDSVTITKETEVLRNDPNNQPSRQALESAVSRLSGRTFKSPQILANLADAQYALGNDTSAKANLDQALSADPGYQPALQLKQRMEIATRVSELAAAAEKEPANPQVKQQLQTTVAQANQLKFANPRALQSIQKANRILKPESVTAQKN